MPSVNPDGVDLVREWYERSKGKPWEGSGMPRLYHPYAGHDTNRDWFMLNLAETQAITKFFWQQWFPQSGKEPVHQPIIEVVKEDFNPLMGMGTIEVWVPVKE